jgi:hypothetical protein
MARRARQEPRGGLCWCDDLARSAQFEHTVLITQDGVDVRTANELVATL